MCGISGTTDARGRARIAAMNAAMVHRGPDDEGIYVDEETGVALGARRLSVIDPAGGHQPLTNERGTVWAVMNGEIYNHPRLRTLLDARGHRFSSRTDTEVLVHLWEDYGEDFVHALEGMYAFALWDAERRLLVLGRDRFGEKPLFYTEHGGTLTFASELSALRAGVGHTWELDSEALDAYFALGYVPGPQSVVAGVRQLEPGHTLVWDQRAGQSTTQRYWSPPSGRAAGAESVSELADEVRTLLEGSLRSRLIADVPLGVFLSGGVDSTLVAALAARNTSGPLKTFSVGYDTGSVDELPAAARTARLLGSEHHELVLGSADVAGRAQRALGELDQPLADQAFVALHALCEFARREVTVAVGGEGADELFGGYPRYRWLSRSAALHAALPAPVAALAARAAGSIGDRRAARLRDVLTPVPVFERHLAWVTEGRAALRPSVYGPRLREQLSTGNDRIDPRSVVGSPNGDVASTFMRLDQARWLPDDVLVKADRASMRASLELRTPYLRRELAELAASVPSAVHLAGGGKQLLRAVLREVLPEAASRRKIAFRVPAADWLRGPLAPAFSEQLAASSLYAEGWLDRRAVSEIFGEHLAGAERSAVLWPVFALGSWFDTGQVVRG